MRAVDVLEVAAPEVVTRLAGYEVLDRARENLAYCDERLMDAQGDWKGAMEEGGKVAADELRRLEADVNAAAEARKEALAKLDRAEWQLVGELEGQVLPVLDRVMARLGASGAVREGVWDLVGWPMGELVSLAAWEWLENPETLAAIGTEVRA